MARRRMTFFVLSLGALGLVAGNFCCSDEPGKPPRAKPPEAATQNKAPAKEPVPAQEVQRPSEVAFPPVERPGKAPAVVPPRMRSDGTVSSTAHPGADIVLQPALWKTYSKGPVTLTHENHAVQYKIACHECHHIYEKGANIWKEGSPVKNCEECHNESTTEGEKRLSPDDQKKNLKLAFHNHCRTCHRKLKKEDRSSKAPTTCGKCHRKKS